MSSYSDKSQNSDRLPPADPEAEAALLGAVMLNNDIINDCITARVNPAWFFDMRNQEVFSAMLELYDQHKGINTITVNSILKGAVPIDYLAGMPESCPSHFAYQDFLDSVKQKYVLRRVLEACTQVGRRLYDTNGDFHQFTEFAQSQFARAFQEYQTEAPKETIQQLMRGAIDRMEERHNSKGKLGGIPTGFIDLDRKTDGMHPGEFIVLAARPSVGKSSLMMNIADHVAVTLGISVAVFSLEMRAPSLADRMLCARARVDLFAVRDGKLTERDAQRLTLASSKISNAPLHIDDTPGITVNQLRAKVNRLVSKHAVKMICVDYLQLMQGNRKENRQQEVSDISNGIKNLASEFNLPVVALSQLNRLLEREKNRRPKLSDLRESGSLEQDADSVWLLYRTGNDDEGPRPTEDVRLLVGKSRNGPANEEVPLVFLKPYTKFESSSKIETEEPRLPYV